MTGFARNNGELIYENKKYTWVWEIKSVNAKGIDIKIKLPIWLEHISESVREICSKTFVRGTISVCLDINTENSNSDISASLFCFLQFSKLEFAILSKYSFTAKLGIPNSV